MAQRKADDHELTLLSWNLDGLDSRDLDERTKAVCQFIGNRKPKMIFLQEVTHKSLTRLEMSLKSNYTFHCPPKIVASYFTVILITKEHPSISMNGEVGLFNFPGSTMGRQLLQVPIKMAGIPVVLYTSHLESMGQCAKERKVQLKTCFEFILKCGKVCIFGGDLNVEDHEVADVGVPSDIVDIWEACGSPKEFKYTWDGVQNDNRTSKDAVYKERLRLDRLYLFGNDQVVPAVFELVGKERLPSGLFPSDHWGLWTKFDMKH